MSWFNDSMPPMRTRRAMLIGSAFVAATAAMPGLAPAQVAESAASLLPIPAPNFTGMRSHRVIAGAGHNLPEESPQEFADAVLELASA